VSYEIYAYRLPNESAWDCGCESLLLDDTRKAWSFLTLVGKDEHKGTNVTLSKDELFRDGIDNERDLAALLDRKFQLAHADRIAAEHGVPDPEREIP
jgi:hypothetical protein